ncbi:hypothetical protein IIC65_06920, partial [Candidatus Sumerlaeota bacterium]|nr:hypothetical protein [Candidatus Sumerlaeota bacterium]
MRGLVFVPSGRIAAPLLAFFAVVLWLVVGGISTQAQPPVRAPHAPGQVLVRYRSGLALRSSPSTLQSSPRPASLAALDAKFGLRETQRLGVNPGSGSPIS